MLVLYMVYAIYHRFMSILLLSSFHVLVRSYFKQIPYLDALAEMTISRAWSLPHKTTQQLASNHFLFSFLPNITVIFYF